MHFPTLYSPTFLLFILASTNLSHVIAAPLPRPIHDMRTGGRDIPVPVGAPFAEGAQDITDDQLSTVENSFSKLPEIHGPECSLPDVTSLPQCLGSGSSLDLESCTPWEINVAGDCVGFTCPPNESPSTCLSMLQSALETASLPQDDLARCYAAKVKDICPVEVPVTVPVDASGMEGIPTGMKARGVDVPGPKTAGDRPRQIDTYPEATSTEVEVPGVDGARKNVPDVDAGAPDLDLAAPTTDIYDVQTPEIPYTGTTKRTPYTDLEDATTGTLAPDAEIPELSDTPELLEGTPEPPTILPEGAIVPPEVPVIPRAAAPLVEGPETQVGDVHVEPEVEGNQGQVPGLPEVPQLPETPKTPEVPTMPEVPATPELPQTPNLAQ